ncbi:Ser Thr phosphatase family [Podospora aff. communis PSN243]|uniref:Ser Thr phosphatase family n=1 Tax=Podospora aff. communis PSN243 TaxID=3040156 RepID=A0AAV9G9V5_9PEZI|nr:Ser Thr phosphatase family [Podospora aff. communis PSN243]
MDSIATFLVLSDTHRIAFPNPESLPKVDVVLHCGDLTTVGGLGEYKTEIAKLKAIDAELKLVIPGNHDVSLDPIWWKASTDECDDAEEPWLALALFRAEQGKGLHLLQEGLHTFNLTGNRTFSVYASPYTPAYGGYAFAYNPDEDRWDAGARNPMPDKGVDIVMTHGPPELPSSCGQYVLDMNEKGQHCGCKKLYKAISRTKPKLHCFGHIHEGYGAQDMDWGIEKVGPVSRDMSVALDAPKEGHTLLVNAAIQNHGEAVNNEPWIVKLELGQKS